MVQNKSEREKKEQPGEMRNDKAFGDTYKQHSATNYHYPTEET